MSQGPGDCSPAGLIFGSSLGELGFHSVEFVLDMHPSSGESLAGRIVQFCGQGFDSEAEGSDFGLGECDAVHEYIMNARMNARKGIQMSLGRFLRLPLLSDPGFD